MNIKVHSIIPTTFLSRCLVITSVFILVMINTNPVLSSNRGSMANLDLSIEGSKYDSISFQGTDQRGFLHDVPEQELNPIYEQSRRAGR